MHLRKMSKIYYKVVGYVFDFFGHEFFLIENIRIQVELVGQIISYVILSSVS